MHPEEAFIILLLETRIKCLAKKQYLTISKLHLSNSLNSIFLKIEVNVITECKFSDTSEKNLTTPYK